VRGQYDGAKAVQKAYVRRRNSKYQGMKVVSDINLRVAVEGWLLDDQSPEAIAGRLKHQKVLPRISKNSVYRFVESVYGRKIESYRAKRKRRKRRYQPRGVKLSDRTFIDERPPHINTRSRLGHVEADFVVSGKSGDGILLVVADRKTRMVFLALIPTVSVAQVHQSFLRMQSRFPELRSITTDNDILFQKHEELAKLLGVRIFFCHPYHSWEKGTVENVHGVIRKDIPKGSDLSRYSKHFVRNLEHKLNRRILKVLDYQTPSEVLNQLRKKRRWRKK
jgi:IS30 family transposase